MKMINLGDYNRLKVVKLLDFGAYLDGGREWGEILLPREYVPRDISIGDEIEVFVYFDSEDRIVATTERPYAKVGDFASLKVAAVNDYGVFLDWGLRKDLLLPYREQRGEPSVGKSVAVYVYVDEETCRIVASMRLERFFNSGSIPSYKGNEKVRAVVFRKTGLGYEMVVGEGYRGLAYANEIFGELKIGEETEAYVKQVRKDGKIDISLQPIGYKNKVETVAALIVGKLRESGGYSGLTDKSSPEDIYRIYGCSKKTYKMALGYLFSRNIIELKASGILLRIRDNDI